MLRGHLVHLGLALRRDQPLDESADGGFEDVHPARNEPLHPCDELVPELGDGGHGHVVLFVGGGLVFGESPGEIGGGVADFLGDGLGCLVGGGLHVGCCLGDGLAGLAEAGGDGVEGHFGIERLKEDGRGSVEFFSVPVL